MKKSNLSMRINTSLILLILALMIIKFNFILLYSLIVVGTISALEFMNLSKKIFKNSYNLFFSNIFFISYLFLFCLLFFYFCQFFQLKIIIFSLLFGCIASDIGGFTFGKIFKGPKLTKISPNKTISGALGAFLLTYIIISSIYFYYTSIFNIDILIVSLITSAACQTGDLIFSFLKRKAKVKDTGKILPGHGGILDRIDGILIGVPIGIISLIVLF